MSEIEKNYASETILSTKQEALLDKKTILDQDLASTAMRLIEIERQLQNEATPITARISTANNVFRDNGWIGGYEAQKQKTVTITARYFYIAYLGALTQQESIINTTIKDKDDMYGTSDYTSVSLLSVAVGENAEFEAPLSNVSDAFNKARTEAFRIVDFLKIDVILNNPYKDIPIKINQFELLDILLRREILEYCQVYDPSFNIQD